jgi:7-cyano-7-deazaguanine synthase
MSSSASSTITQHSALAILVSGGIDSAILVGEALREGRTVHPVYVRTGLAWETAEQQHLRQFLDALRCAALRPLHVLEFPVADVYGRHWSLTGDGVPDEDTPDEAVFLPGRNVLLLSKSMLWCHLHGVPALALAPLASNPFPDATPEFFAAFGAVVNQGISGRVEVLLPYLGLSKTAVLQRGRGLPLQWTFSCIQPREGKHCGHCNKCAERQRAFRDSDIPDPTVYRREPTCSV